MQAHTEAEKILLDKGYVRHKCVFNRVNGEIKTEWVPMEDNDVEYYFSTMRHLDFMYKKGDCLFKVGIYEYKKPAYLFYSNRGIIFSDCQKNLHQIPADLAIRIQSEYGAKEFIDALESESVIPIEYYKLLETYQNQATNGYKTSV